MRPILFATIIVGCGTSPSTVPIPRDDHFTIIEDDATTITTYAVKANDIDVSDIRVVTPPQHGTMSSAGYAPDPGYHGPDMFTYTTTYGGGTTATVTIDIMSDGIPYEQSTRLDPATGAGLAIADVTGDGKPDFVSVQSGSDSLTVLVNTSTPGKYTATPLRFEAGHQPRGVAIADFDGDGRPDLVTASELDGLVVLRNLTIAGGPVAFDAPMYVPSGKAVAVVAVDLDGDGRADLASLDANANALDVRINTSISGAIAFGARTSFATSNQPSSLAAVDADGVGGVDLIVLEMYPTQLSLFTNATAIGDLVPTFGARLDRATGAHPASLFVADLDGDGRSEIGVIGSDLWIYKNQSAMAMQPSYEAARVLPLATATAAVAAFDLDANGATDLVLGAQPFSLLFNTYSPITGFDFDAHRGIVASGELHKALALQSVYALQIAEVDGVAPPEIVLTASDGTYVLFGD